jgi:DNA helicase-2/ATP-dependent DNA helicase PcrA
MSSSNDNRAILAAAGSRKTEYIIESALAVTDGRVLITTYTNENQRQILSRIEQKVGAIPVHITVMGWFSFLIAHCAKPYQRALTGEPLLISGLNFKARRNRFTNKANINYFLDNNADMYRDGVSDFVATLNNSTDGAVVTRLEKIFTHIFVDEVQDLVGYDLDVLDLLLASRIKITLVGDPRQHTLSTNIGPRNKKYHGVGLTDWFAERSDVCILETRKYSYRCNQAICDFADAIYPNMPATTSIDVAPTGHDGIFRVATDDVARYIEEHHPITVLRHDKNVDTEGLPAMNIGVAKGSTFDRVMIFPTKPMLKYFDDGDCTKLKAPERLYVAVTRARFSVAFVVPNPKELGASRSCAV